MAWHGVLQVALVNRSQHLMTIGIAWFPLSNTDRVSPGEEFLSFITYCPNYKVWNKTLPRQQKLQKETQRFHKRKKLS